MGVLGALILGLWLCAMSPDPVAGLSASDANAAQPDVGVTMALRRFDMTEQALELQCEIANGSNHDVWVCESIETGPFGSLSYAPWMDPDGRTLVIRRHLGPELRITTERPLNLRCRYVRVAPGQRHASSFTLDFPVLPSTLFASGAGRGIPVTRLVVEIGCFDEDLPEKIYSILEMADRLGCVLPPLNEMRAEEMKILFRYFGGMWIFSDFEGRLGGFDAFYREGNDSVEIPWEWPIEEDESHLAITTDGVAIPYAG